MLLLYTYVLQCHWPTWGRDSVPLYQQGSWCPVAAPSNDQHRATGGKPRQKTRRRCRPCVSPSRSLSSSQPARCSTRTGCYTGCVQSQIEALFFYHNSRLTFSLFFASWPLLSPEVSRLGCLTASIASRAPARSFLGRFSVASMISSTRACQATTTTNQ